MPGGSRETFTQFLKREDVKTKDINGPPTAAGRVLSPVVDVDINDDDDGHGDDGPCRRRNASVLTLARLPGGGSRRRVAGPPPRW